MDFYRRLVWTILIGFIAIVFSFLGAAMGYVHEGIALMVLYGYPILAVLLLSWNTYHAKGPHEKVWTLAILAVLIFLVFALPTSIDDYSKLSAVIILIVIGTIFIFFLAFRSRHEYHLETEDNVGMKPEAKLFRRSLMAMGAAAVIWLLGYIAVFIYCRIEFSDGWCGMVALPFWFVAGGIGISGLSMFIYSQIKFKRNIKEKLEE